MSADILEQAFASTARVLANVSTDQLDRPTPCASWTVRDLVNHIVGATTLFAVTAETGTAPTGNDAVDHTAGDTVAAFDQGARRAVRAFQAPGVMDRTMRLPFGDLPGSVFVQIAAIDTFTHGWDLAKATGQPATFDPALGTLLLDNAQAIIPDAMRGPDGQAPFGPRVEVSDAAPAIDRLAGFMGRHP
jgi:uncharacterized protein (TIGR03086 family)